MGEKYSLSVIIPNYNKVQYLNKCIESVINQTLKPDEIIIVDDCSTDGSQILISGLKEKYDIIKSIYLDENAGVSNARNVGLNEASSEYVSFLDSDDYYYANYKLEKEMALIKEYDMKGQDIVSYSAMVIVSEYDNPLYIPVLKKPWYLNGNIFVQFVSRIKTETIPRDYIVKKSVIEEVGAYSFPKNLYEDLDLLFRLSKKVPFYCTLGYGTAYVQTKDGLSKAAALEHTETIQSIVDTYKKEFSEDDHRKSKRYILVWKIERVILRILRKIYTGI
ncbi:MAG: glycosyltransferase [Lachnospiraceae bacterium]|nr:glycosyltransferase [Lachnospiraceae bacterium]